MLQPTHMTSEECRRHAEEALTLAAQAEDTWEREKLQGIITQWQCVAVYKRCKETNGTP
jgi:hypothetical protein